MKKLAIYISSFDGYSDIWSIFFKIWDKYCSSCPYPIYLTSNFKDYNYNNLFMLKVGCEISWIDRTIKTLEMLEENFIIFFLEDYFISKKVDFDEIDTLCNYMHEKDIYYYQLSLKKGLKKNEKYLKSESMEYPISLQPAIWNREKLISSLYEMKSKKKYNTPWDFEKFFIEKFKNQNGILPGIEYDTRDIMGYKNGVLQGKWIRSTVNFYKKEGIEIDCSERKKMTIIDTFYFNIKILLSTKLSKKNKNKIKIVLKKFGFKFMIE